jgi:hypothetical protein
MTIPKVNFDHIPTEILVADLKAALVSDMDRLNLQELSNRARSLNLHIHEQPNTVPGTAVGTIYVCECFGILPAPAPAPLLSANPAGN